MASKGERNNNPGNLEASPWTRSQPGYVGSDGRFAIFDSMASGIAAQEKLLSGYISKGFNTISSIINRYGNDHGTGDDKSVANYKDYISQRIGKSVNDVLSRADLGPLTAAMREFETGNTKKGIGETVKDAATSVVETVTNPVGALTNWFAEGFVSRITYVVIGVILIGLAIASLVFMSDAGQKIATTAAKTAA